MTSSGETQIINGVSIHFTLDGPDGAPTLTFAPALSLDLRSFDSQVAAFSDRYRVLRLDLRGHGFTDQGGGPFSMEDLADDVVGLLDHIGADKTHFVGSSLGAMVGLALAFNHADRLSSLTFMASQGALPPERLASARDNIAAMRASGATVETTMADQADAMLNRLLCDPDDAAHPERNALLRKILGTTTLFGQARAYEAILDMDYDGRLDEIHTPTLVLAGAQDSSTTPERMQMYKDGIAGAKMELLQGAGHFPNVEQPGAFNAVLARFLNGLPA
ncbi:MAG: alpha/beta fold hydrolase [Rhodospirillaceae bacterium]|jgi:3-oxoadipate enol-lactonase|nr:alpha/beta fold hydrolase [Rhodospirillaceae bacterium]MBT5809464.1 alpha/beta fold hydrolase [Rhodospirillaceae bacterium]